MAQIIPGWTGEPLAHARRAAGLSCQQLATRLGVASAQVERWESGVCPPARQVPGILTALDITIHDLTGTTPETITLLDLRLLAGRTATEITHAGKVPALSPGERGSAPLRPQHARMLAQIYGLPLELVERAAENSRRRWHLEVAARRRSTSDEQTGGSGRGQVSDTGRVPRP